MSEAIDPARRRGAGVGIIGAGRLGSALAAALRAAGYDGVRVGTLADRDPARATRLAGALALPPPLAPAALAGACALVFLCVPDGAVRTVADAWPAGPSGAVVHCSGALGLDVLATPATRAAVGTFHPLQTFPAGEPPVEAARRFAGVVCGVEASSGAAGGALGETLEAISADLGARAVRLEGVDRAGYHAAAVLASNDAVALMAAAARAWSAAGLPAAEAREALAPLMLAAARNIAALPLERALTGPVARGDVDTVARHLAALAPDPDLRELYRRLAFELLALDLGHDAATAAALRAALAEDARPRGT